MHKKNFFTGIKFYVRILLTYPDGLNLVASLLTKSPIYKITPKVGSTIYGNKNSLLFEMVDEIFYKKRYLSNYFREFKNKTIIDAGGNVGIFAIFASKLGAKKIYCLEPKILNFEQMRVNLNINKVKNVTPLCLALANENGYRNLYSNKYGPHASFFDSKNTLIKEKVKVIKLESLLKKTKNVDLLKIDTEGAEAEIILNSSKKVWEKIKNIVLEYHDHLSKISHFRLIEHLEEVGFTIETSESNPEMGYIYAKKIKNTSLKMLYKKYHALPKLQKKIINKNSFTYGNIIKTIDGTKIGKSILDIGCGVGTVDFYLAQKGNKVKGIDISEKAISMAKKNSTHFNLAGKLDFEVMDFPKSKPMGTFDFVICSEVLEHIPKVVIAVKKLNELLKQNGRALITVPSSSSFFYKLGLTNTHDIKVGHLRRFSVLGLKQLFENYGFKIIKSDIKEGPLREALFVFPKMSIFVKLANKFLPVAHVINYLDNFLLYIFGGSDLQIIVKKL